jgi:hypothetical protein
LYVTARGLAIVANNGVPTVQGPGNTTGRGSKGLNRWL